jgi:hypothetical protein
MHQVKTSYRRIPPTDLPTVTPIGEAARPMNDQELLNAGIVHISGDIYSCIHQEERDEDTLEWRPKDGQSLPGTVITEGVLADRHAKLPSDVRSQVMRAQIIRSKTGSAKAAVSTNLAELSAVLANTVGLIDGAPLVDTTSQDAQLEEAQRLIGVPDSGLEREFVSMADVVDGDIVEADSLIPHSWAGEPKR